MERIIERQREFAQINAAYNEEHLRLNPVELPSEDETSQQSSIIFDDLESRPWSYLFALQSQISIDQVPTHKLVRKREVISDADSLFSEWCFDNLEDALPEYSDVRYDREDPEYEPKYVAVDDPALNYLELFRYCLQELQHLNFTVTKIETFPGKFRETSIYECSDDVGFIFHCHYQQRYRFRCVFSYDSDHLPTSLSIKEIVHIPTDTKITHDADLFMRDSGLNHKQRFLELLDCQDLQVYRARHHDRYAALIVELESSIGHTFKLVKDPSKFELDLIMNASDLSHFWRVPEYQALLIPTVHQGKDQLLLCPDSYSVLGWGDEDVSTRKVVELHDVLFNVKVLYRLAINDVSNTDLVERIKERLGVILKHQTGQYGSFEDGVYRNHEYIVERLQSGDRWFNEVACADQSDLLNGRLINTVAAFADYSIKAISPIDNHLPGFAVRYSLRFSMLADDEFVHLTVTTEFVDVSNFTKFNSLEQIHPQVEVKEFYGTLKSLCDQVEPLINVIYDNSNTEITTPSTAINE